MRMDNHREALIAIAGPPSAVAAPSGSSRCDHEVRRADQEDETDDGNETGDRQAPRRTRRISTGLPERSEAVGWRRPILRI